VVATELCGLTASFFHCEISLADTLFDTRLASESTEARQRVPPRSAKEMGTEHRESGKSASGPASTNGSSALRPGIASSING
jgi:hypothetical protein